MTMHTATDLKSMPETAREDLLRYAADMVTVDAEIEAKLDRQIKIDTADADAKRAVQRFHDDIRDQRDAMKAMLESHGQELSTIRDTGAGVIGKLEGAISQIRNETLSKALRDDYTSFGLGSVGYMMLYTTAKAAGSEEVAALAQQGMKTYADAIQTVTELLPEVISDELSKSWDTAIPESVARDVRETTGNVWQEARSN